MQSKLLSREDILQALINTLEPLEQVNAFWEGGAICFDRFDEWSDIDFQIDVADEFYDEAIQLVINTLESIGPIDQRYDLPQPTWHGHFQSFIRLKNTSPFLVLDMVIMKNSNQEKFLEKEIHGQPVIHFDKCGVLTPNTFKKETHLETIQKRLTTIPVLFDLFQVFVKKEVHRGNAIEATAYYNSVTIKPLVELLRIHHNPIHYNFHTRYVYVELPPEVIRQLEPLFYPKDLADLAKKQETAAVLFQETLAKIDLKSIKEKLDLEITV